MNREELAWAAGLFDGEGYIGLCVSSGKYRHLRLTVGQADPEVLCRFQNAILGLGRLNGPTANKGGKDMWALNVNGFEPVQATVAYLWRWLSSPKQTQARLALAAAKTYYLSVRPHVRAL